MQPNRYLGWLIYIIGLGLFTAALLALAPLVSATPLTQDSNPTPESGEPQEQLSIADSVCLDCHGQPGETMVLENGDLLDLYVPAGEHAFSVHGESGYACVQCHSTVGEYPHPPFNAADRRDATLQLNKTCDRCHYDQVLLAQDSVHAAALESGNQEAAVCSDCHTAHAVRRLTDPETGELLPDARVWTARTCGRCHSEIYLKYRESVHGSALVEENNQDVPTCIDCHGVHNIEDPTTAQFRLNSPQICAECHIDPDIMDEYGISTHVLDTYVADFHGTSVVLFEQETPDADINKPVCYDCHGVHDIARADDPHKGLIVKGNLLRRCQECHPDATDNFPDSWLSHYIPSPDKNPLVYYVDLFYKILIPVVLGGMGLLVGLDFSRMTLNSYRKRKSSHDDLADVGQTQKLDDSEDDNSTVGGGNAKFAPSDSSEPGSEDDHESI